MDNTFSLINNYENYEINIQGYIRNIKTNKFLKWNVNSNGYATVMLCKKGVKRKTFTIHRLIATQFINNPLNKPQVNHIDGNKLNNNINNLEWATSKENVNHCTKILKHNIGELGGTSVLNSKQVLEICELLLLKSQIKIAKQYNVSICAINSIASGRTWTHLTENVKHIPLKEREFMKNENKNKLTEAQVLEICQLLLTTSKKKLAEIYNISNYEIRAIANGTSWNHITKDIEHIPLERNLYQKDKKNVTNKKLSPIQVIKIKKLKLLGTPTRELAKLYNVSNSTIYNVCANKTYCDIHVPL